MADKDKMVGTLSWHRFWCQFVKDLRSFLYLFLLFQIFRIVLSVQLIPLADLLFQEGILVSYFSVAADYISSWLHASLFDLLLAAAMTIPLLLGVTLVSLFTNIECSARYMRSMYIMLVGFCVMLIYLFYYFQLQIGPVHATTGFFSSFSRLHMPHVRLWTHNPDVWLTIVAIVVLPIVFTWFVVRPWINKGAYVACSYRGVKKIYMASMQILCFLLLICGLVWLALWTTAGNIPPLHLSDHEFMNASFMNPVVLLLQDIHNLFRFD